jgi:hypothetical protein
MTCDAKISLARKSSFPLPLDAISVGEYLKLDFHQL